ncbi:MAG: 2-succinylbenzoate--CoA ligase [Verrucomicrobiota bacterium]|jgi:O-succinylbenzoic acid--CoA ligase
MNGVAVFHRDHGDFLAAVAAAWGAEAPVFLGNPHWGPDEMAEAMRLIPAGTTVVGMELAPTGPAPADWPAGWRGRTMIPTGGTGGRVKFAVHDPASLAAAVRSLRDFLAARGLAPTLHGATLTPPWHVSGLMPFVRAALTGGRHVVLDGRFPADGGLPKVALPTDGTRVASLVPAQLMRLLARRDGEAWLRRFKVVLLGGSAVPPACLRAIRDRRLPVFLTYGMTETAAACALCPPERLWRNQPPRGTPLPGVRLGLEGDLLTIASPALARGLWPAEDFPAEGLRTQDRAELAADGTVRILGRADRVVVTGGEKVDPARVEAALAAVASTHVLGLPDPQWGERVVALVVGAAALEPALRLAAARLEPAARPKAYAFVAELPTDARGKFDRAAARALFGA